MKKITHFALEQMTLSVPIPEGFMQMCTLLPGINFDTSDVPLPEEDFVSEESLDLVLKFFEEMKKHPKETPNPPENAAEQTPAAEKKSDKDEMVTSLPDWAEKFFDDKDKDVLFYAMNLANYLGATFFVEHGAFFIANKIRGLSISDTRDYLNMENDFEPGEFDILANDATWRPELLKEGLISKELADGLDTEESEDKKKADAEKKKAEEIEVKKT